MVSVTIRAVDCAEVRNHQPVFFTYVQRTNRFTVLEVYREAAVGLHVYVQGTVLVYQWDICFRKGYLDKALVGHIVQIVRTLALNNGES